MVTLGSRFEEALVYAAQVHAGQRRKTAEGDLPGPRYVGHLLGVASLVIEDGGNEDEAIAALLHDAAEDQGGAPRLDDIRARFGEHVADIVAMCTDALDRSAFTKADRKRQYLDRLRNEDVANLRVPLADKLYNARAILMDLRTHKAALWARFSGTKDETLVYYQGLADIFDERCKDSPMAQELRRVVDQITELAGVVTATTEPKGETTRDPNSATSQ